MATYDLLPQGDGVRLTLISDDGTVSLSEFFDHRAAEAFVKRFCLSAGLPTPWTKG